MRHPCKICGKIFSTPYALEEHMRVHIRERVSCTEPGCSKDFSNKANLARHDREKHRKERERRQYEEEQSKKEEERKQKLERECHREELRREKDRQSLQELLQREMQQRYNLERKIDDLKRRFNSAKK